MMSEKIEIVLVKRKISKKELAERLGYSPSNLYNKLKRDNFTEKELQQIASVLNCSFDAAFTLNDTQEKY